ncbi:rna-dependent rna polymerase 1 [Hordeum vulgare]|nr:rna-dependent rna polymerase 1 [Hordeum vulgare]
MERKYSVSPDISYLTIWALVELEGSGMDVFLTYVKEEGKGLEGVEVLDSEEKAEEMLDLFVDKKLLNVCVRKATDPSRADVNIDHIFLEEQISVNNVGEPVVYRVSQEDVLYPASDSTLPVVNPDEPYLNTQQSCNFNKGKMFWRKKNKM